MVYIWIQKEDKQLVYPVVKNVNPGAVWMKVQNIDRCLACNRIRKVDLHSVYTTEKKGRPRCGLYENKKN